MNSLLDKPINIRRVLIFLLHLYAVAIPFEFFFEYVLEIDTYFKPYRIIAISIILLSIFQRMSWLRKGQGDHLLLGVHIIGLIVTFCWTFFRDIAWITFFNYIHVLLSFVVLLVVHGLKLSRDELSALIKTLVITLIGVSVFITVPAYLYGEFERFSGFYKNPNYAAFAINFTIFYLTIIIGRSKRLIQFMILLPLLVHQVMALLATGSRSGIIAMIILMLLIFLVAFSGWRKLFALTLVLLLPFVFNIKPLVDQYINKEASIGVNRLLKLREEANNEVRLSLWRGGWDAAKDHYFIGIGIQQFNAGFQEYMKDYRGWWTARDYGLGLHSLYLTILVEYGFLAFLLLLFYLIGQLRQRVDDLLAELSAVNILKGIVFLQLMLFAFTTTTLTNPTYWFIFALVTTVTTKSLTKPKLDEA
jgi:O-antigen ligase